MSDEPASPGLPPLFGEEHVCVGCGVAYGELPVPSALALVAGVVVELGALLPDVPVEVLRRRLHAGEWSALEYAGHIRDVLFTFAVRIHRGVVEDRPALDPMYADWRAERFGYNAAVSTRWSVDYVLPRMVSSPRCEPCPRTRGTGW